MHKYIYMYICINTSMYACMHTHIESHIRYMCNILHSMNMFMYAYIHVYSMYANMLSNISNTCVIYSKYV